MSGCCSGNCGNCNGCAKQLTLSEQEIDMLGVLSQIPFLPVARRVDDMTPIYLEDNRYSQEQYSLILQVLEKKALISIDYDKALIGFDMRAYKDFPVHGSFALTQKGQTVVDMLDKQGLCEESL